MVQIAGGSLRHLGPDSAKTCMAIPGPRSFPPIYRGRPFGFRSVSTRCLVSEASRFPAGFSPAPHWPMRPRRSPVRHIAPRARLYRPVGIIVVFLRRARRSRVGAGWGSPRIVFPSLVAGRRADRGRCFFSRACGKATSINQAPGGRTRGPVSIPDCLDLRLICPSVLIGFQPPAFNTL